MKNSKLSIATTAILLTGFGLSQLSAADITVSSYSPHLYFDDTNAYTGNEWYWYSYQPSSGSGLMALRDIVTNNYVIKLSQPIASASTQNSLVVDSNADINLADGSVFIDKSANALGVGTTTPEEDIHVVNTTTTIISSGGAFPITTTQGDATLKLDAYDNSSWSIGAKYYESSLLFFTATKTFAITDNNTTNIPFSIYQGAPTGSLKILNNYVNIGTKLNVNGTISTNDVVTSTFSGDAPTNSDPILKGLMVLTSLSSNNTDVTKTSDVAFGLKNAREDFTWNFRTFAPGEGFLATKEGTGGGEFRIDNPTNDFTNTKMVVAGVTVFENGHLVTASSRELKTDIKPLDPQAAMDALHKLQPVSYEYKAQKGEPVVGFIAEDVPDLVAMPSRKSFDSAEVVAVLTSVVKEQEKSLAETRAELKAMRAEITALKAMK